MRTTALDKAIDRLQIPVALIAERCNLSATTRHALSDGTQSIATVASPTELAALEALASHPRKATPVRDLTIIEDEIIQVMLDADQPLSAYAIHERRAESTIGSCETYQAMKRLRKKGVVDCSQGPGHKHFGRKKVTLWRLI